MSKIKEMLSFNILKGEIEGYGFKYSFKKFIFTLVGILGLLIITSFFYELYFYLTIFICVFTVLFMPTIIRSQYKYIYENKRFSNVITYLEQMCYSFQKTPKILVALQDTNTVMDGEMKKVIEEAIHHIKHDLTDNDIYLEAFEIIENKYDCTRIKALHRFLYKVETQGGEYTNSLNVLVTDIQQWTERTFLAQKDRKELKSKFTFTVVLSFIMSSISVFVKQYIDITESLQYQLGSTAFICLCVASFSIMQSKFNVNWLAARRADKLVNRDYVVSVSYKPNKERKKLIPMYLILAIGAGVSYYFSQIIVMFVLAVLLFLMIFIIPDNILSNARKRTVIELQQAFPEWLRDVAMNLQFYTVQMSIEQSVAIAPPVLKDPLINLVDDLAENPTGIEPFHNFLSAFNLLDITSAMKMLYSLTEMGTDDVDKNINSLIERNYAMIDKTEKIHASNKTSALSFLLYLPMIFAVAKLLVDMMLLLSHFMTMANSY